MREFIWITVPELKLQYNYQTKAFFHTVGINYVIPMFNNITGDDERHCMNGHFINQHLWMGWFNFI